MTEPQAKCPSCGEPASGRYCSSCGVSLAERRCRGCGIDIGAGARFCHVCGAPQGYRRRSTGAAAWIVAGVSTTALLVSLGFRLIDRQPTQPPPRIPTVPSSPAPDISNLTPRERADRLFERIMIAEERGLEDTVSFFIPMALSAYSMIGSLDADARYHVGLIHALSGNLEAVQAQLDSLVQAHPNHLLGYMLAFTLSRLLEQPEGMQVAYRGFLEHYDDEVSTGRSEYDAHRRALDAFQQEATRALGTAVGAEGPIGNRVP